MLETAAERIGRKGGENEKPTGFPQMCGEINLLLFSLDISLIFFNCLHLFFMFMSGKFYVLGTAQCSRWQLATLTLSTPPLHAIQAIDLRPIERENPM